MGKCPLRAEERVDTPEMRGKQARESVGKCPENVTLPRDHSHLIFLKIHSWMIATAAMMAMSQR
ncbi:MAG: hypothetical protein RLZZ505_3162 [Verrucomicrobiota bacterium]|jgi:hypothetical protein